jgi:hypothetical protein
MPVTNDEFDAYLEDKAKANGFAETEKGEQRRPNYFIDKQAHQTKKENKEMQGQDENSRETLPR